MSSWQIDGYALSSLGVRDVESRFGWEQVSAPSGEDVELANRSGKMWVPKRLGPGTFTLAMWFTGATEQAALSAWWDVLRVSSPMNRLVTVQRTLSSGAIIRCEAQRTGTIQPVWLGRRGLRAVVTFTIPSGMWKGNTAGTVSTSAGATLPKTLAVGVLAESTAPVEDAILTVTGPITNPLISDITVGGGGDTVLYTGNVPTGGSLILNCETWSVTTDGSWTANAAGVTPSGPRYLTLYPAKYGTTHQVRLSGSGGGAGTKLDLTAAASYL